MSPAEPTTNPVAPIELTEAAARAIVARAEREGCAGAPMRIRIQGGGCSGVTYKMSYETKDLPAGDFVRTEHGATVVIDQRSAVYLKGSTLDYKAELMSQRFVWTNTNAKSSCGCGESFSI